MTEYWDTGILGYWNTGILEEWKRGRVGEWKSGRVECWEDASKAIIPNLHHSTIPCVTLAGGGSNGREC
jgi:hypothetical protein